MVNAWKKFWDKEWAQNLLGYEDEMTFLLMWSLKKCSFKRAVKWFANRRENGILQNKILDSQVNETSMRRVVLCTTCRSNFEIKYPSITRRVSSD
ncbi:hypothetical protein NPIL_573441 [Nephila pilipes]|uniref:Uncharacterized protein n=1 Tax=Nephila pilipes TaxID=299642 RepID=A0A8X6N350_NEPPI|nr:hypothetical protein NPIL_573441 [Nephila pilipes]